MNFDALANKISKSATFLKEEAEVTNPEFNHWYSQQDPAFLSRFPDKNKAYRHWRAKHRGGPVETIPPGNNPASVDAIPLAVPVAEPTPDEDPSLDEPLDNLPPEPSKVPHTNYNPLAIRKTQLAIDEFKQNNPEATLEDVLAHLETLNDNPLGRRTSYITNRAAVEKLMSVDAAPAVAEEPSASDFDAEKKAKADKLRAFLKMTPTQRRAFLGQKEEPIVDDEEEDEVTPEPEVDDDEVSQYIPKPRSKRAPIEDED